MRWRFTSKKSAFARLDALECVGSSTTESAGGSLIQNLTSNSERRRVVVSDQEQFEHFEISESVEPHEQSRKRRTP